MTRCRLAIASLFGTFGSEYQDVVTQFEAFHNEFQRTAAAGATYLQAETAAATALAGAFAPPGQASAAAIPWVPNDVSLIMSGTGVPIVTADFISKANNYIGSNLQLQG